MSQYSEHFDMLKNAVAQPVAALTAVETDTVDRINAVISDLKTELKNRPHDILWFSTDSHALKVLDDARLKVSGWQDSVGVLFLADHGDRPECENQFLHKTDEKQAYRFWNQMNLLRESWAGLDCHTIFFLLPSNYRMLLNAADHLADWMPLKLHLTSEDDIQTARPAGVEAMFSRNRLSPQAARQQLTILEQCLTTAIQKGEDASFFLRRYYLPMFEAAVSLGNITKAKSIRDKISEINLPDSDLPKWRKLNYELDCLSSLVQSG